MALGLRANCFPSASLVKGEEAGIVFLHPGLACLGVAGAKLFERLPLSARVGLGAYRFDDAEWEAADFDAGQPEGHLVIAEGELVGVDGHRSM
ncbi:hypothetical protein ACFUJ0_03435 [Streptomyces sp. NPDC057242]|uniref:hypothetical protein n=1 Tax=Streptomyces sp. NPDC057242 TaxID=3346063 RepID=UPI003642741B